MTAKSVLLRPEGLRPRARAPLCYATAVQCSCTLSKNDVISSVRKRYCAL